jgi:hypothetical protein
MQDNPVRQYLASIGQKGGRAGAGAAKLRGDSEYYRRISRKAADARKAKKLHLVPASSNFRTDESPEVL